MRGREFRARDKKVQKLGRDGLVEQNKATGEERRVSQRTADLLSGFTENYTALLIGVNLGGLGTLIASMASLISYKLLVREDSRLKGRYFRYFTLANLCFLGFLLLFAFVLSLEIW